MIKIRHNKDGRQPGIDHWWFSVPGMTYREWIELNGGTVHYKAASFAYIAFENEEDAVAFKLRFM